MDAAGGRLDVSRRLLSDVLFDSEDGRLRAEGTAVRVRRDGHRTFLTFKGRVQRGPVKSRDEFETTVGDPEMAELILAGLGLRPWLRTEKFREEYLLGSARVVIDETPIGVFIEIEATPHEIDLAATQLGRGPADYRLESYSRLYFDWCQAHRLPPTNMTF